MSASFQLLLSLAALWAPPRLGRQVRHEVIPDIPSSSDGKRTNTAQVANVATSEAEAIALVDKAKVGRVVLTSGPDVPDRHPLCSRSDRLSSIGADEEQLRRRHTTGE